MKLSMGLERPSITTLLPPTTNTTTKFQVMIKFQCYNTPSIQPLMVNKNQPLSTKKWEHLLDPITTKSTNWSGSVKHVKKLGNKWMEYQGISNWEGLLDPLDDNLRSEILRYGAFVDAAYKSFDFDSSSPTYATCRFPKSTLFDRSGLRETGYRITKHLRATSGVQLPLWIDRAPSWLATQSSWIGYVAVCQDKEEIARLGRRDVVISYRGTATCLEWFENLRATLSQIPNRNSTSNKNIEYYTNDNNNNNNNENACDIGVPMVESGFLSLYTSRTRAGPSLQDMVREEIKRLLRTYKDEPLSLTLTGHSLGAALATLTAYDIKTTFNTHAPDLVTVISFGGPRVGNKSFRQHLEKQGTKVLRIVNSDDLITKVPGFIIDGDHEHDTKNVKDDVAASKSGGLNMNIDIRRWIQKRVKDTQWMYAEVGRELRLSSKNSPYIKKVDVATCHDLKTYLHLVNGFVSSSCPFRATARRVLNRHRQN